MFCERLKAETAGIHKAAESRPFIRHLMSGSLNRRAYARYVQALAPIYVALESCMRRSAHSTVEIFDHRELDRSERMRADLSLFGLPPTGQELASTRRYCTVIEESESSPHRLLAHHYTRLLGDMAGGQAIAQLMQRHYDISPELMSFYDFSGLGDIHHYRKQYKTLLDLLPWSPVEQAEFIAESELAYQLNISLFDELATVCGIAGDQEGMKRRATSSTPHTFLAGERRHSR